MMMKHQIKEVLEAQVEQATFSLELKTKTLNKIKAKPHKKIEAFPISLKQFSIITAISLIVGIGLPAHYFSSRKGDHDPNLEEVRIPDYAPQMRQPLSETLSELELDYQESIFIFEDQTMMNFYIIEGLSGYEIQFPDYLYQINICEEVVKILDLHGVKERPLNVIELGKSRVFVYREMPAELLEYLDGEDKMHYCL